MTGSAIPHTKLRYILFYKPYGVASQFSPLGKHGTLKEFGPFPSDVYPVGRLDADSEGLLLLTNDALVQHRLTDPQFGHTRTYLVQIEGIPEESNLEKIRKGVILSGKRTRPAQVARLALDPVVPPRPVPVRFRKNVPTCWIELTLREGKNRQVRRMTAAVGHPTLRLVRTKIEFLTIEGLSPGQLRELTGLEVSLLKGILSRTFDSVS